MELSDAIKAQEEYSAKASDNVRFLAVAGIGIVWLLSEQKVKGLTKDLLACCLTLVLVLCLDFLQYLVGGQIWNTFVATEEAAGRHRDDTVAPPRAIHRSIYALYWAKVGALVLGYACLAWALVARMAR